MRHFTRPEINSLLSHYSDVSERKIQVQDIVYKEFCLQNQRGSIEIATGVGKTRIAILAIEELLRVNPIANIVIAVPTKTLQDTDWPNEFIKWNAEHLIKEVCLVTHVSLPAIEILGEIDLLIIDEVHHLTPNMTSIFDKYQVWSRMGLSALLPSLSSDFERRTLLDKYFPVVFKLTLDDALDLKLITDFEIVLLKFHLDDKNMNIKGGTEKMPVMVTEWDHYQKLTRQLAIVKSKGGAGFYWIQKRTELIANLPTKKQLAKEIMALIIKDHKRTLIFCGSKVQCEELGGKDHSYHSGTSDKALIAFNNKEIDYLCSVKALNEGKNLIDVDQSFIVQASAQLKDLIQRIGRNVRWRQSTDKVKIIILVAAETMDEVWITNALYTFDKRKIKTHWIQPKTQVYGA